MADAVDETYIDFIANPRGMDPQAEQENEDVRDEIIQQYPMKWTIIMMKHSVVHKLRH